MRRLTSMSMSPGSSVTSPRSTTTASSGTDEGPTATMRSSSTSTVPGSTYSPESTSSRRAARSNVGCSGVRRRGTTSDGRFDDGVEHGRAAVGYARLAPHLDRERRGDERAAQPQEAAVLVGDAVHRHALEVLAHLLEPREHGVV